jgi:hypothetical protein
MISFMVTFSSHCPHVPATKYTLPAGLLMDMLLAAIVYEISVTGPEDES